MNKNKSKLISLVIVVLTLGLSFSLHFSLADWQSPATNPPNDNAPTPINIGPSTQTKTGALILNTWGNSRGLIVDKGNSGIGTINPYAKLDVMGGVKVGEDSICNASKEGTIRYNPSEPSIDYCNGTDWVQVALKCTPYCPSSYTCGDDGCGGSCGTCPANSTGANYCHASGNVYHDVTSYSCNSSHICVAAVTPTLVTNCTDGCSGGACIIPCPVVPASAPACSASTACGSYCSYNGDVYPTVQLGTQCWFRENLRTKYKPDGITPISRYCYTIDYLGYFDDCTFKNNCMIMGGLYDWVVANDLSTNAEGDSCYSYFCFPTSPYQGICPTGWHIPTRTEWLTLVNAYTPEQLATISASTFSLSAAGECTDSSSSCYSRGEDNYFWSSTPTEFFAHTARSIWIRWLTSSEVFEVTDASDFRDQLYSIRCLKNP